MSLAGISGLYPWLKRQFNPLTLDIKTLLSSQLPKASPDGLAATAEGLALMTGLLWFVTITLTNATALKLLDIHKTCVGAIELYLYGHGFFAPLHLLKWWL